MSISSLRNWVCWIKEKVFCKKQRRCLICCYWLWTFYVWWLISAWFGQNQPIFWFILGIYHFFLHLWQLWQKKNNGFVIGSRHFRFNHCSDRVQFRDGRSGSCNVRGWDQCLCRYGVLFSWRDCIKFEKTKILHSCPNSLHNCSHNNDLPVLFNR